MPEKPGYSGLFKEGFVLKTGNIRESPDYPRFSNIVQKIDQHQRLLYLEWNGSHLFLGARFKCESTQVKDGRSPRGSRRMYVEQIPYGNDDLHKLDVIVKQFYQHADTGITSYYSDRYDNIHMKLGTSAEIPEFTSDFNPTSGWAPGLQSFGTRQGTDDIVAYFAGKILSTERCSVLSTDVGKSLHLITDLFECLKQEKNSFRVVISELDNPQDTKLECDVLVKVPIQHPGTSQHLQSFTYDADTLKFHEDSKIRSLYISFFQFYVRNTSCRQHVSDSQSIIDLFVQSYVPSEELVIRDLCHSKLGKKIAKEILSKKIQNDESVDSEDLTCVYSSLEGEEQAVFGTTLIDYGFDDLPDVYRDSIKLMILDHNQKIFDYFTQKDFRDYRNFHTHMVSTFNNLPWDNSLFRSHAKKILAEIFSKFPSKAMGEGGKIFTRLLYQNLSDHGEINHEFIQSHAEKIRSFEISIPVIPDKSFFCTSKLHWFILVCTGFAAGILFSWIYNLVLPIVHQKPGVIMNPSITVLALVCGIIIIILVFSLWAFKSRSGRKPN